MPAWAHKLQASQAARHHRQAAIHAVRDGDRGGHGAAPDIKERD
jgi:type IV secretion system protein TrbL